MKPRLSSVYPKWYDATATNGGGVFKDLAATYSTTFTWLTNSTSLDLEYYGNHSGKKSVSPIIETYLTLNTSETDPTILTSSQRSALASIIKAKFENKWTRIWDAIEDEYDPIENYNMTETETPNLSTKYKVSDDYEVHSRQTNEFDQTVTTNSDSTQDVYGFNSTVSVPQAEGTAGSTVNTAGAATDNEQNTYNTQEGYRETLNTGTRTLSRHGNIGVTLAQKMLSEELKVRQQNFFEQVYKDVDSVLTIPIYNLQEET